MLSISYYKFFEFLFIFICLPLLFFYKILPPFFIIPILWILTFYIIYITSVGSSKVIFDKIEKSDLYYVLKRFFYFACFLFIFTYIFYEDRLFNFILEKPKVFIFVLFLYPILSVIPQELIFRKFFLFRYELIFRKEALIILNALVFSFIHIIFQNYIAVLFSLVGGYIFMKTYIESKSFTLVCIEHSLYGNFIFTVGLGEFFYHGNIT
ncbi:CPBP family intramembrane glutamic endopeptidase [Halarcobacter sp.]|uniref:CPBP family intramembrane glutamic endopeptidase n=1 Tax=Halarcobacter sp. TaxID=2321133 RepID=UPI002AAB5273|nr:CPBP family intramembrane glutamic endopeptidase [Halarcobacter sp.]